jgi:hypothetical protein
MNSQHTTATVRRSIENSPRAYARVAGALYLVVIVAAAFAQMGVRGRLQISGDAAATAGNILAHEQLYRWGFAAEVVAGLCVVPLILLLYELLKVVNRRIALLAVFFSLVGCAVEASALLGHFAPLMLLRHGNHPGVTTELGQGLAYVALELQGAGFAVALAFFGGTMLARGYLIIRSTFLPRAIGVLLAIQGVAYLANSFVDFLAPALAGRVFRVLMLSGVGEVSLCLWLLIVGVNARRWMEQGGRSLSE